MAKADTPTDTTTARMTDDGRLSLKKENEPRQIVFTIMQEPHLGLVYDMAKCTPDIYTAPHLTVFEFVEKSALDAALKEIERRREDYKILDDSWRKEVISVQKSWEEKLTAANDLLREVEDTLRHACAALSDARHHGLSPWPEGKNCIGVAELCSGTFERVELTLAKLRRHLGGNGA